jgi:hypothetical protein
MAGYIRLTRMMSFFGLLALLATVGCITHAKIETMQRTMQMQAHDTIWQHTVKSDNISAYERFLRQYPDSPKAGEARHRLDALYEDQDWKTADAADNISICEEFLRKYPRSRHAFQIKAKMEILRRELAPWKAAQEKNTIEAYQDFLKQYPKSIYAEKARGKIVDLEVADIMRTQPGKLPPPQKVSSVPGRDYSLLSIHNDTKYNLSIRYSGPHSFKIKLAAGEKREVKVQLGKYRVAASADSPRVKSYAGEQSYEGGDYKSRFFTVDHGTTQVYQPVYKIEPIKVYQPIYKIEPIPEKIPEVKPLLKPIPGKIPELKPVPKPVPAKKIAPVEERPTQKENSE